MSISEISDLKHEEDEVKIVFREMHSNVRFYFTWLPEHVAKVACHKLNQFSAIALYQRKGPFNWTPPENTIVLQIQIDQDSSEDAEFPGHHGFVTCSYAHISNHIWNYVPSDKVRLCVIHFWKTVPAANPDGSGQTSQHQQDSKTGGEGLSGLSLDQKQQEHGDLAVLSHEQMLLEIRNAVREARAIIGKTKANMQIELKKTSFEPFVSRLLQEIPEELTPRVGKDLEKFWEKMRLMENMDAYFDVSDSHSIADYGKSNFDQWMVGLSETKFSQHTCHDCSPQQYIMDCSDICTSLYKLGCFVVNVNDGMQRQWISDQKTLQPPQEPSEPVLKDVIQYQFLASQKKWMRDPDKDISPSYTLIPKQPLNRLEYSSRASFSAMLPITLAKKLIVNLWRTGLFCYYQVLGDCHDPPATIDVTYYRECSAPYFVRIGNLLHYVHAFYDTFPVELNEDPVFCHLIKSTDPQTLCELNIIDSVHGRRIHDHLYPVLLRYLKEALE